MRNIRDNDLYFSLYVGWRVNRNVSLMNLDNSFFVKYTGILYPTAHLYNACREAILARWRSCEAH